ncbi:MAG: zinc ribbon domain-containing protein [Treponema sp.]|nr:zinc ribbon domain-containing protein [Treponema sp.]
MNVFAQAQSKNAAENQKRQEEFRQIRNERPKFCIHCGAPLEDEDEFCTECGEKIESELAVEETVEESAASKESSPAPKISSDRLASIMQTTRVKSGGITDEYRKNKLEAEKANLQALAESTAHSKSTLKTGYYVHKDSEKTQYLIIESVGGNYVSASVKTTFLDGGYSTEHYTGTVSEDNIELSVSETDLHPLPNKRLETMTDITTVTHTIQVSNHFSGTFSDDRIIGNFSGGFSQFVVFTKD